MRHLPSFAAIAMLVSLAGSTAKAEQIFDFTFYGTFTDTNGYGTLVADANGDGTYTAIGGTITDNIGDTGYTLVANPNAPGISTAPNGFDFDDQLLPGQDPLLTGGGLLFGPGGSDAGAFVNIFSNGPGSYEIAKSDSSLDDNPNIIAFTLTPVSVPEPSSLALCGIASMIGVAYARARRKRAA
jgi:PEP-CTERM motif